MFWYASEVLLEGVWVLHKMLYSFKTNFSISLHQCLLCTCLRVFLEFSLVLVLVFISICKLPHCSNMRLTGSPGITGKIVTEAFLKLLKYYGIGFDKSLCCDFMMWILKNYLSWNEKKRLPTFVSSCQHYF